MKAAVVIPPKSNRKTPRFLHRELYKKRHKAENAFLKMKQWRGELAQTLTKFVDTLHIILISWNHKAILGRINNGEDSTSISIISN
jgi:transposase